MNVPQSPDNSSESRGVLDRLDAIVGHLDQLTSEVRGLRTHMTAESASSALTQPQATEELEASQSAVAVDERPARTDITRILGTTPPPAKTFVIPPRHSNDAPRNQEESSQWDSVQPPGDAVPPAYPRSEASARQGAYSGPYSTPVSQSTDDQSSEAATPGAKPSSDAGAPTPWWKDDKKLVRVIAGFGVVITLLGVGFLVAVAIAAGLFPPVAQVTAATVLGIALGVGAWKAQERKVAPPAVTAVALTAMGTLILSGYGFTHYVELISALVTYPLITAVAVVPLYFARRWDLPWLAGSAMILSFVMLLPAMTSEPNIAPWSAVAVVAIVLVSTTTQRDWLNILYVATALGTLGLFIAFARVLLAIDASGPNILFHWVALGFSALLSAAMVVALHRVCGRWMQRGDFAKTPDTDEAQQENKGTEDTLEYLPLAPLAFALFGMAITSSMLATLTIGVVMLIAMALSPQRLISAAAAVVVSIMTLWHFYNSTDVAYLIAVAAFMAVAIASFYLPRTFYHRSELSVWVWLGAALVVCLPFARSIMGISAEYTTSAIAIVVGLAIMAFVAHLYMSKLEELDVVKNNVAAGLIALYLAITGFMLVFISFGDLGFRLGHALVSFALIGLGAYLLVVRSEDVPAGAGALLVVVAIGKLIFFDMASIDGIIRTLAFIASGILLLGIAVARGKYKTDDTPSSGGQPPVDPDGAMKGQSQTAGLAHQTSETAPTPDTEAETKHRQVPENPYRAD